MRERLSALKSENAVLKERVVHLAKLLEGIIGTDGKKTSNEQRFRAIIRHKRLAEEAKKYLADLREVGIIGTDLQ